MKAENGEILDSNNLQVHPRMKELYKFFKYNGKVVDIENYKPENLDIYSRQVHKMITAGISGWDKMIPEGIAQLIRDGRLFGYHSEKNRELSNQNKGVCH